MPEVPLTVKGLDHEERPLNVLEAVLEFDDGLQSGRLENYRPAPLGFPAIDKCLGGGMHAEDLLLVGGVQNVGKTIFALQVARNLAISGQALPILVCYEHSPQTLLHRLLCLESIDDPDEPAPHGVTRAEIETAVLDYYDQLPAATADRRKAENDPAGQVRLDLQWLIDRLPAVGKSWARMETYLDRLWLARGDGRYTSVERLERYVEMARALGFRRVVLIVDYAQRVPIRALSVAGELTELQRIDFVMRGLKGLALQLNVPVLAVAAADAEGLRRQHVHVENLWGPATVQYEPDAALILNRDVADGESGERTIRVAIEKNRSGPSEVEFRHRLHGAYYCLSRMSERIAEEESFQVERVALRTRQQSASRSGVDPTVALFLWKALDHVGKSSGEGDLVRELLTRALRAEDGGASLIVEIADRLGLA